MATVFAVRLAEAAGQERFFHEWDVDEVHAQACGGGGDSFSPSVENVAGTYSATTFTLTSTAGPTNLLLLGATVSVTLAPDGTTSGHLHVPGDDQGTDVDENLAGTWTLSGSTVTFSQSTAR